MKNIRRSFIKKSSAIAAISLAGLNGCKIGTMESIDNNSGERSLVPPTEPYMKIAYQAKTEPEENDIKLMQQMGISYVVLPTKRQKTNCIKPAC